MGTTVEKADYAFETKDLLKTEINKINNVLDDNSTFRSYPQELFNGYLDILNNGTDTLWNNLEKVSASGEEATLENVETAPMKMVLNGNTSQDGEPTPDTPVEVKVVKGNNVVSVQGKNRFTTDYLTSNNFTTYAKLSDNSFSFTATGTWKRAIYNVPCKPNTDYYFNINSASSMYIQIKGVQTGRQILGKYSAYLTSFNSGENTELEINIGIGNNSIASETISDIQLEEGTAKSDFIPYSKTDYPINLGDIELCKINTYKDFPFKAINGNEYYDSLTEEQKNALNYGSWYVHKEIGKVVLDGSENWNYISSSVVPFRITLSDINVIELQTKVPDIISSHYKVVEWYNLTRIYQNENYLISQTANSHVVCFKNTDISTLEDFKTWLSSHNVTLYYALGTPVEEQITDTTLIAQLEAISNANSVADKTYITQTNDELPFILDVEAIKEYEVN